MSFGFVYLGVRRIATTSLALSLLACASSHPAPRQNTPTAVARGERAASDPAIDVNQAQAIDATTSFSAVRLSGGAELRRLCERLRDQETVTFRGNAVEQERQKAEHGQMRAQAAEANYVIDVPSSGFHLGSYDLQEGRLWLVDRIFQIDEGAALDRAVAEEPIGFALVEDQAVHLLKKHAEGKLRLRLVIQPQASQMRPDMCIRQSGGRIVKLGVQVLGAYIRDTSQSEQSQPLAKFETESFAQTMAQLTPVNSPAVRLGAPMSADSTRLPAQSERALSALQEPLLACYRKALEAQPTLAGTVVVTAQIGPQGRLHKPRVEMTTIHESGLIDCVLERVAQTAALAGGPLPAGVSLPITFGPAPG